MTFADYLDTPGSLSIPKISEASDVSIVTLRRVRAGMRLRLYDVAKRVSLATGGVVTVEELCE